MAGFTNPYEEPRATSKGELDQQWAELFKMASFLAGMEFTDREKSAIAIVIGAVMREKGKIDLDRMASLIKLVMPK